MAQAGAGRNPALVCVGNWYRRLQFPALWQPDGFRSQTSDDRRSHYEPSYFGWRFFIYNLRVSVSRGADGSPYFPFIESADLPEYPAGNLGTRNPYGLLVNIPFVMFALGLLVSTGSSRTYAFFWCTALAAAGTGLALTFFAAATNRYMVDFLPAIHAARMFRALGDCLKIETKRFRPSCGLGKHRHRSGLFVALQHSGQFAHNDLLRLEQPEIYRRLSRIWNWPSHIFDRISGTRYGPNRNDGEISGTRGRFARASRRHGHPCFRTTL